MPSRRRTIDFVRGSANRTIPGAKTRKPVPHEFVLEALAPLNPRTRAMFSCLAIYIGPKIVMALRSKGGETRGSDGVWLATKREHHETLRTDFPNMKSIPVLGPAPTGWQLLAASDPDFEESALRACELILTRDPRIGKVPAGKRRS